MTTTPFNLSRDLVKSWSPCADGYSWFLNKFPDGGPYTEVHAALREDNRLEDADWLFRAALANALNNAPAVTANLVSAQIDEAKELIDATCTSSLKIPTADDLEVSDIGSSGDGARIGSSGYYAQIGSSGDGARIGSSGCGARIGSSGYGARINAAGPRPVIACTGIGATVKAGADGALAVAYQDKSGRMRFAVGYVGENIAADTWYRVNNEGGFVVEAA